MKIIVVVVILGQSLGQDDSTRFFPGHITLGLAEHQDFPAKMLGSQGGHISLEGFRGAIIILPIALHPVYLVALTLADSSLLIPKNLLPKVEAIVGKVGDQIDETKVVAYVLAVKRFALIKPGIFIHP
jgi:hypothetical protein